MDPLPPLVVIWNALPAVGVGSGLDVVLLLLLRPFELLAVYALGTATVAGLGAAAGGMMLWAVSLAVVAFWGAVGCCGVLGLITVVAVILFWRRRTR